MLMQVRITKSTGEHSWYKNRIGETFNVIGGFDFEEYLVFRVRADDAGIEEGHVPCVKSDECVLIIDGYEFLFVKK